MPLHLIRGEGTRSVWKSGTRLELVFYRGEAKTTTLRRIFGPAADGGIWAGLYLKGRPGEMLSMDREVLEFLTPPYASISFTLQTNDSSEHANAKAALESAAIMYNEPRKTEKSAQAMNLSETVYWLSGSTLNRDIYRLVFGVMYGPPTLLSHRFIFTVAPPPIGLALEGKREEALRSFYGKCIVYTYYWQGLQLVSRELREDSVEALARRVAGMHNAVFEVRNR